MPVHKKNGMWWFGSQGPFYTKTKAEEVQRAAYANGYTGDSAIALDKTMSRRRIDENGYLHVTQTHLTKEQVAPYFGKEIPGWEQLGLEPEKVYYGYRSGEELERAKDTFNGMPLLIIHKQDSAHAPLKEERVGSIGTTPVWDAPYLDNALTVTDQNAISAIDDGSLREISCGYFFEPDFTPGEFNGVHYDFVMRNIRGNHVALVKEGRAGPDVSVHDGLPSKLKVQKTMQLNRKQVAVRAALATFLMPRLTVDAAPAELTKLVGSYKKPASLAKAVSRQYSPKLAQDMEIEPEELAELIEATEGVVEPDEMPDDITDPAFDEDNAAESLKAMLEGKVPDELLSKLLECLSAPVGDEAEEAARKEAEAAAEAKAKEEKKEEATMDANAIALKAQNDAMAKFRSLNEAGRKVRDLIGEVDVMAFDSAEDIYGHALKQKGIKVKDYDKAAYKGMVDMLAANKPSTITTPVHDHAPVQFDGQFAGLKNIKI